MVKNDVMAVMNKFYNLNSSNFQTVNSAQIALIPKKEGDVQITDFRPISLMHSIAKIISKILANRLPGHIGSLISVNQSAFIKTEYTR